MKRPSFYKNENNETKKYFYCINCQKRFTEEDILSKPPKGYNVGTDNIPIPYCDKCKDKCRSYLTEKTPDFIEPVISDKNVLTACRKNIREESMFKIPTPLPKPDEYKILIFKSTKRNRFYPILTKNSLKEEEENINLGKRKNLAKGYLPVEGVYERAVLSDGRIELEAFRTAHRKIKSLLIENYNRTINASRSQN